MLQQILQDLLDIDMIITFESAIKYTLNIKLPEFGANMHLN